MEKKLLVDYRPPQFLVPKVELFFKIHSLEDVVVQSRMLFHRQDPTAQKLVLDGEALSLLEVRVNGQVLTQFEKSENHLSMAVPGDEFEVATLVRLNPAQNTALSGLYKAGPHLMTQCEAEGFRRITYSLDRPDVMSSFTVTIEADKDQFPVLLSNGDQISDTLEGSLRRVTWKDPFKKPSYLFALVAGSLGCLEDHFITRSGKRVRLQIFAEVAKLNQCHWAMESLKRAMKWDEERFGLEYDLSTYMIVATDDFNAGAMENKGLNLFNSRLVYARLDTATDARFEAIESVIAHEYFHNWTGNRVTLRDWFHLSLKEGLTVFRDQEFSMDQISRDLVRIQSVKDLRESQFAEDQGPNAHAVRPESCYSVDNFFTSTIYEKGAEVIRMMQTMVGRPGFREGMDLYFQRHDGQAVTIEDFAKAIADGNELAPGEWDQFKLWYTQAGTPRVRVEEKYTPAVGTYELHLEQTVPPTPGQTDKKPMHIPLEIELLDQTGRELPLMADGVKVNSEKKKILHLRQKRQIFTWKGLKERPLLSLNRGFSAPVEIDWERDSADLLFLLKKDTDAFSSWEAGQTLLAQGFFRALGKSQEPLSPEVLEGLRTVLLSPHVVPALKAYLLKVPTLGYLAQKADRFRAEEFAETHHRLKRQIGRALKLDWMKVFESMQAKDSDRIDSEARGYRALKNLCLSYLCWEGSGVELAHRQFSSSKLMTDLESSLFQILQHDPAKSAEALDRFYNLVKDESLNSWFLLQSLTERPETFARVQELSKDARFKRTHPNSVYSLLGSFGDNLTQFHAEGGKPYEFLAKEIHQLDQLNPQVAARIAGSFDFCLRTSTHQQQVAARVLGELLKQKLSSNTYEILSKTQTALTSMLGGP